MRYSRTDLTVVLCTANRKELAESFIEDYVSKFAETKLLVIENSPNSKTFDQLSSRFASKSDVVEILRSVPPGLSRARNLAISKVKTPLLAFTDDDCRLNVNWVDSILRSSMWNKVDALGGSVEPLFLNINSKLNLTPDILASLAVLDLGKQPLILKEDEFFYGANMIFKKSILSELQFNESLGRIGDSLLSGEEIDIQNRMTLNGWKRGYDPSVRVEHLISVERLNPEWFVSRFAWQGVSDATTTDSSRDSWMSDALDFHSNKLEIGDAVQTLLNPPNELLEDSLKVVRYLIFSLLTRNAKLPSKSSQKQPKQYSQKLEYHSLTKYYPIDPQAKILAIDFRDFHDFLFDTIDSTRIAYHFIAHKPWEITEAQLKSEFINLHIATVSSQNLESVVIGSLDSLLHPNYFKTFYDFIQASSLSFTACLHRAPNFKELENLRQLDGRVRLITFSTTLQSILESLNISALYTELPMRHFRKSQKLPNKKLVICFAGEVRSRELVNFIVKLTEHIEKNFLQVELKLVGGIKDLALNDVLRKTQKLYPQSLILESLTFYEHKFRVIPNYVFCSMIEQSDYIVKIQTGEEAYAASAVIADAMSIGARLIVLEGTEGERATKNYKPRIVISNIDVESFMASIDSHIPHIPGEASDAIAMRRSMNNKIFVSNLFGDLD